MAVRLTRRAADSWPGAGFAARIRSVRETADRPTIGGMSALQDGLPVAVYRYLPEGWGLDDPLPPVHSGAIYHYTNLAGVHGLIASNVAWASHVLDMNDPSERLYGWGVIRKRFKSHPPSGSDGALRQLRDILRDADEPGAWYPRPFVLSGSAAPDSLTQYRLYGQCQVEIVGGRWTAAPAGERHPGPDLLSEWRPVLYGARAARPYVDRMLRAAVAVMDAVPPEDFTDEALTSMLALEVLALHIKNKAYEDEREVRLVFSAQRYHSVGKVRVSGERLVTYVEARPAELPEPDIVCAVRLGPLATGPRNVEALRVHHRNHTRSTSSRYDLEERGLKVQLTKAPFRN